MYDKALNFTNQEKLKIRYLLIERVYLVAAHAKVQEQYYQIEKNKTLLFFSKQLHFSAYKLLPRNRTFNLLLLLSRRDAVKDIL
jgi:hypothetical protein